MHPACNQTLIDPSLDCGFDLPLNEGILNQSSNNISEFDLFNHCLSDAWKYDNDTICEDPLYFSHAYRIVGTLFQSVIFIVGIFGNIMVVVVVGNIKYLLF